MYKIKTRRSASKRFQFTAKKTILRRKSMKNHLLEKKTSKRKNNLSKKTTVNVRDIKQVSLMLPYN
uniref:50S ribosomal protein L35 n=1 Tax=Glaucocystis incrassata TaxID=1789788 RepID=A0A3G1IVP7_9EUKA|nr:ribosomal protein L35 [Glaucocystis incrassata]ASQ40101.1 ribosomal protein L35 [Glaucocystis incrassata]